MALVRGSAGLRQPPPVPGDESPPAGWVIPRLSRWGWKSLLWLMELQTVHSERVGGDAAARLRPFRRHAASAADRIRLGLPQGRRTADLRPAAARGPRCVSACLEAFRATSDEKWLGYARRSFVWFLGRNDLGIALYDPSRRVPGTASRSTAPMRTRARSRPWPTCWPAPS